MWAWPTQRVEFTRKGDYEMPNEVWYVEGWKDGSDQRERSWHYSLAEAICREGDLKYEGFTTAVFHAKMVEVN